MKYIHPSAEISSGAVIGEGTRVWHQSQVREGARIGVGCTLGKCVYIDTGVSIGDYVKIQNGVSVYQGVTLQDGVFCGPGAVFTNDLRPRAVNPDGSPRGADEWAVTPTLICRGASIGANATIKCGVTIGKWAMVGAGSVVTHDVPDHGLMVGNPARLVGFVCACGASLAIQSTDQLAVHATCVQCHCFVDIPADIWRRVSLHEDSCD